MIPMACPNCQRRGNVPRNRLNKRIVCRQCGIVFHVDNTGQVHVGDPPGAKPKPDPAAAQTRSSRDEPFDVIGAVARALPKTPRPVAITLGVVFAAILVGGLVQSVGLRLLASPSRSPLESQSLHVAKAFVDQDQTTLLQLTDPETTADLIQWYERARGAFEKLGGRDPSSRNVQMKVYQVNVASQTGRGDTSVLLIPPSGSPKDALKGMNLRLYWTRDDEQWLLDGSRLLDHARQRY